VRLILTLFRPLVNVFVTVQVSFCQINHISNWLIFNNSHGVVNIVLHYAFYSACNYCKVLPVSNVLFCNLVQLRDFFRKMLICDRLQKDCHFNLIFQLINGLKL